MFLPQIFVVLFFFICKSLSFIGNFNLAEIYIDTVTIEKKEVRKFVFCINLSLN